MGYYLWNLLRDVYLDLGQMQVAKATGGSVLAEAAFDQAESP